MSLIVLLILCSLVTFLMAIVTFAVTARLWRRQPVRWLLALTFVFMVSSLGASMTFISPDFQEKVFFFHMRVLGMVWVAPFWLLFLSSVFDRWRWIQRPLVVSLLLGVSGLNFILLLLPSTRPMFFGEFAAHNYLSVSFLQFTHGPWYRAFYSWSMLLMLLSYALSAVTFWHESGFRRRQVLILNAGLGIALLQAIFPLGGATTEELRWISASTFSLIFTQAGILYAVVGQRLLNLVPLAAARVFQKFPDPVLVIDDHARLMGASDRAISFFALKKDFLGQAVAGHLPNLKVSPGEQCLRDSQGRSFHFHVALEPLGESDSSPGTVVFFRDIGAQKQVEQRLQEGMEFRARLLAFLAHDLTGFLENQAVLAQSLQTSLGSHSQVDLLAQSAQASQELVSNVMTWAKSQNWQFQPESRTFEWNTLVREALEQMESRLSAKGVRVKLDSAESTLVGRGDSEMLLAVLRNFLSNSLRASSNGQSIQVSLREESGRAALSVRDEGGGIGAAELALILEVTQDFSLGGMPGSRGSGLGLMLARHFIAAHQGSFQMRSNLGVGTEVSFSVPL